jgi:hypothetical protein
MLFVVKIIHIVLISIHIKNKYRYNLSHQKKKKKKIIEIMSFIKLNVKKIIQHKDNYKLKLFNFMVKNINRKI